MNKFLNILSRPSVSIILRKIVELNFIKEKDIIREHFPVDKKNDRILDLGCGTGEFSPFFPAENYVGIDIDERNIDYAKAHYKKKFLVADARKLPFEDNSFSKILIVGVFHHLSDKDCLEALGEARRVLQSQGKLFIMEDVDSPDIGFFSGLMHRFDQGGFIRTGDQYRKLLGGHFIIAEEFFMKSGIYPYQVFLLNNGEKIGKK